MMMQLSSWNNVNLSGLSILDDALLTIPTQANERTILINRFSKIARGVGEGAKMITRSIR
jgi:hypothetical protein